MELTPEQLKSQEIVALTWMPWWQYLTEDLEMERNRYEQLIHSFDLDDVPRYSQRTVLAMMSNVLETFIKNPSSLLDELSSIVWK